MKEHLRRIDRNKHNARTEKHMDQCKNMDRQQEMYVKTNSYSSRTHNLEGIEGQI